MMNANAAEQLISNSSNKCLFSNDIKEGINPNMNKMMAIISNSSMWLRINLNLDDDRIFVIIIMPHNHR